ncbi:hypothetical protein VTK73DRAFT_6748 [Phialemonium thermophilum]|uniref:Glycosyltransferase 2 n=1 Tax=Phialemonium thermophilum TaxID=223376 RepID=A0ABR3WHZ3_9PEZI
MVSLFLTDEELGKKDDDHKPAKLPLRPGHLWSPALRPTRKTVKRSIFGLLLCICVYLFVKNIPTDVPIRDHRRPVYEHDGSGTERRKPGVPLAKPAPAPKAHGQKTDPSLVQHGYNGPLQFLNLASSLYAITNTKGGYLANRNVLFAASSLKSAAGLLPLACSMGAELRSYVHFALMSRSEIELEELRRINGVDDTCHIIFHDARPDHSSASTDARLSTGTSRALEHIYRYMHPQALIVDGSSTEERPFLDGLRTKASSLEIPLIELPEHAPSQVAWISKLDSASLAAWNKASVDILVHAPPSGSGSLIRLLRSLSRADFTASAVPHLTIELPYDIDMPTAKFLQSFKWPPAQVHNPTHANQLSLRHRIPREGLTEEESSVRLLESFWPAVARDSHVLVLSPQAEVSPQFFHYLRYTLLEYKYSNAAVLQQWEKRLLGISLHLPATLLNASEPFRPPTKLDAENHVMESGKTAVDGPTSFLWQAPNSDAMLLFGQKWAELHGFVSRLLEYQHKSPPTQPFLSQKLVSKKYPAWLEHALQLCRARGYWTLYPSEAVATDLATIHNELYQAPEEFEAEFEPDPAEWSELVLTSRRLLEQLPDGGSLPPFKDLPLLAWDGKVTNLATLDTESREYTVTFREAIGGCEGLKPADLTPKLTAADLFCSKENAGAALN